MIHMKLKFKVFDKNGNDITNKHEWYVDSQGHLYFMTNEINSPLVEAEDSYKGYKLEWFYESTTRQLNYRA